MIDSKGITLPRSLAWNTFWNTTLDIDQIMSVELMISVLKVSAQAISV